MIATCCRSSLLRSAAARLQRDGRLHLSATQRDLFDRTRDRFSASAKPTASSPLHHETRVAAKPISAFSSFETGHHAFTFDAIDWNVSWSMRVIFTVTERWTEGTWTHAIAKHKLA
jgi:hypothetical protein